MRSSQSSQASLGHVFENALAEADPAKGGSCKAGNSRLQFRAEEDRAAASVLIWWP